MITLHKSLVATLLTLGLGFSALSNAAYVDCADGSYDNATNTATTTDRYMLIDDSIVSACLDSGYKGDGVHSFWNLTGNVNPNNPDKGDAFLELAKDDGFVDIGPGGFNADAKTFTFDDSLWASYDEIAVGFKFGGNPDTPDTWFVYSLQTGVLLDDNNPFKYFFSDKNGLSHVEIYGKLSSVPVPAAVYLFGSALIGLFGLTRRRKSA